MLRFFKTLTVALTIVLTGCAASVQQTPAMETKAQTGSVQSGSSVARSGMLTAFVTGNQEVTTSSDWSAFVDEWKEALTASAEAAGMPFFFAKDEATIPASTSVLVRLTVNDFRYMSTAKRYMLGIMAGNAFMDVDAQYVELPAQSSLASKKFNTSSSAWEGIFSAATPKQVRTVSEIIVKDLTLAPSAQ